MTGHGVENGGKRKEKHGMVGVPPRCRWNYVLSSYEGSYIHAYAWSGTGTRSYSMVRAHLCDRRSCNTCLYPSTGSVRACQTDDEKEVVHSRYPREVEGIRAGVGGGGGTGEGAARGARIERTESKSRGKWKREEESEGGGRKRTRQTEKVGRERGRVQVYDFGVC